MTCEKAYWCIMVNEESGVLSPAKVTTRVSLEDGDTNVSLVEEYLAALFNCTTVLTQTYADLHPAFHLESFTGDLCILVGNDTTEKSLAEIILRDLLAQTTVSRVQVQVDFP